ncbi:protein FAM204A isoform X2 [Amia ocellicauda]|uniref:protein FAM204A isoform X2 n=1 Tax=Amia ocellicauda TaxID=2972642 RepID=UPI003463B738
MYSGLLPRGYAESDESCDEAENDVTEDQPEQAAIKRVSEEIPDIGHDQNDKTTEASSGQQPREESSEDCLPGVSPDMWKKFKELQNKNMEMKNMMQHRGRRRKRKPRKKDERATDSTEKKEESMLQAEREAHWNGLKQYFGVNDRFQPPACSRPLPKTGLEKSIDKAIAEGDLVQAGELSDRLATREIFMSLD